MDSLVNERQCNVKKSMQYIYMYISLGKAANYSPGRRSYKQEDPPAVAQSVFSIG